MPVINTDVGTVNYVTPSWHNVVSSLTIEEGGQLVCSSFFGLGYSTPGGVGHLYMNGGVLFPGTLYVGKDGRGEVHLDGGRIHANVVHFGGKTIGTGSGNLDITKGLLLVNGDITASDFVSIDVVEAAARATVGNRTDLPGLTLTVEKRSAEPVVTRITNFRAGVPELLGV